MECLGLVCVMWRAEGGRQAWGKSTLRVRTRSGASDLLNQDWPGNTGEGQKEKKKCGTKVVSASAHTRDGPGNPGTLVS